MDETVRSLYIRVLRGKYERGRGNTKNMRNIAAEIEWFYQYDEVKKLFNNDEYCPEEIFWGWTSSRMPRCYKWAKLYLVEKSENVVSELQHEEEYKKQREKDMARKQAANRIGSWLKVFSQKIKGK